MLIEGHGPTGRQEQGHTGNNAGGWGSQDTVVPLFALQRFANLYVNHNRYCFLVREDFLGNMAMLLHCGADGTKVWGDQAPTDEERLGYIPVTQALVAWDSLGRTLPSSPFLTWRLELHPESLGFVQKRQFCQQSESSSSRSVRKPTLPVMVCCTHHSLPAKEAGPGPEGALSPFCTPQKCFYNEIRPEPSEPKGIRDVVCAHMLASWGNFNE